MSVALALAACAAPPPAAPAAAPAPPPKAQEPVVPDLSPVPEPAGLVVLARAARPIDSLRVVSGWAHQPPPDAAGIAEFVAGENLGPVIDLEQPIDLAVAVSMKGGVPEVMIGVSAALRSMEDARQVLGERFKLAAGKNGSFRVHGMDEDEDRRRPCDLMPAFGPGVSGPSSRHASVPGAPDGPGVSGVSPDGPGVSGVSPDGGAPARLVCADSVAACDALGPYLARSAARIKTTSDLHAEIKLAPIRPIVQEFRPRLEQVLLPGPGALQEVAKAILDDAAEFATDLDEVTVDAKIADAKLEASARASFGGTRSLLARIAVAHPERADVPPVAFWRLPGDADAAMFHRGIDAKELERPRQHLANAVRALFAAEGLSDADQRALADAVDHYVALLGGPIVYAKGLDPGAPAKAADHAASGSRGRGPGGIVPQWAGQRGGWSVVGVGEPALQVGAVAREWAAAWSRSAVAALAKKRSGDRVPLSMKITPAPRELPKETVHLEIAVPAGMEPMEARGQGKKAAPVVAAKPIVMHVLVVPDGAKSWIVFAADGSLAVAKARTILSGPEAATLARARGLDALRDARAGSAGFVTARAFETGTPLGTIFGNTDVLSPSKEQALHEPATPVVFTVTSREQSTGGSGTLLLTIDAPRGAIDEALRGYFHH
jgi:hypothetical protein